MHLKELRRSGKDVARYAGTVADKAGARHYELTISGNRRLVEKVFAKSDYDIRIDAGAGERDAEKLAQELWKRHSTRQVKDSPGESIDSLRKTLPRAASRANSLVISLRRTDGEGTYWSAFFPALVLPTGASLFFVLPPVCNCFGTVFPLTGDADLFLSLGSPFAPIVAASARGGTAIDSVAFGAPFCWPWTQVVPWFRVFGFTPAVTGFLMSGFGTFP